MATILITGANRGIGLELSRQYLRAGNRVIACCRQPNDAAELQALATGGSLTIAAMDVTEPAQIAKTAADHAGEAIDILINNAGIMGPEPLIENLARQHFGSVDYDVWEQVLRINTFGPMRVAEAFVDHVAASEQKKIVTLSSSVGSIGGSSLPAMAYASSKAALNKAMTLAAKSLAERGVIVAVVCPGWVKTRLAMGGGDITAEQSAEHLRGLFARLTLADCQTFHAHDGSTHPW